MNAITTDRKKNNTKIVFNFWKDMLNLAKICRLNFLRGSAFVEQIRSGDKLNIFRPEIENARTTAKRTRTEKKALAQTDIF